MQIEILGVGIGDDREGTRPAGAGDLNCTIHQGAAQTRVNEEVVALVVR